MVMGGPLHRESNGGVERLNRAVEEKLHSWMLENKSNAWLVGNKIAM